ncbi:universal stress protein [Amaricoccus sp. W119]|uniref:universal stress protein n=1 Tax=Amaricoccus sp. W119 TaxID=3391833 RepID=UPI0039A511EF
MSFKTVFMTVAIEQDDAALNRAIGICQGLDAHLVTLVLGVASPPPVSPYGVVSNDLWASEVDQGQADAKAKADKVEAVLAASGISYSVEPQFIDRGSVTSLAARYARYADLTLIAPRAPQAEQAQDWVMNGALFESGRPILLLPEAEVHFPRIDRVIIAWDASVEASKSVRDAIGLLKSASAVDAVLIDPVPSFDGHGPEPGSDLSIYLGRHGIKTTVHRMPREGQGVSEILLRAATDFGADLIVMGGFGHSRLRQRFFGGTTTNMMQKLDVPVMMAH